MKLRGTKLLAVLTAAVLTLGSGTVQAYASVCQPAEKVTQDTCCPDEGQRMQSESCTMEGCDCSIDSKPTQQKDAPAISASKAPTWIAPAIAESELVPIFEDAPLIKQGLVIHRDRGPPSVLAVSGNGLRAPPSRRA